MKLLSQRKWVTLWLAILLGLLVPPVLAAEQGLAEPAAVKRAADGCPKGFFWPFVRRPGDCLTTTEKTAGMTGNYQDPEGTFQRSDEPESPVTTATPDSETPAATETAGPPGSPTTVIAAPAGPIAPTETATPDRAANSAPDASPSPAARVDPPLVDTAATESTPAVDQAAESTPSPIAENRVEYTRPDGCPKGFFWPFVRQPGDCLTTTEKAAGMTGNYPDPEGVSATPAAVQRNQ